VRSTDDENVVERNLLPRNYNSNFFITGRNDLHSYHGKTATTWTYANVKGVEFTQVYKTNFRRAKLLPDRRNGYFFGGRTQNPVMSDADKP